jgi:hypothetical protein
LPASLLLIPLKVHKAREERLQFVAFLAYTKMPRFDRSKDNFTCGGGEDLGSRDVLIV